MLPSLHSRPERAAWWARLMRRVPSAALFATLLPFPPPPRKARSPNRTVEYDRHECRQSRSLGHSQQGQLFDKLIMILRTNEITRNVLSPQTRQAGVFVGAYQSHCRKDICDKHDEMEPCGHVNLQNGRGGAK